VKAAFAISGTSMPWADSSGRPSGYGAPEAEAADGADPRHPQPGAPRAPDDHELTRMDGAGLEVSTTTHVSAVSDSLWMLC
jgi:hypothetical protein